MNWKKVLSLGNENKKFSFLFCIALTYSYLCRSLLSNTL